MHYDKIVQSYISFCEIQDLKITLDFTMDYFGLTQDCIERLVAFKYYRIDFILVLSDKVTGLMGKC